VSSQACHPIKDARRRETLAAEEAHLLNNVNRWPLARIRTLDETKATLCDCVPSRGLAKIGAGCEVMGDKRGIACTVVVNLSPVEGYADTTIVCACALLSRCLLPFRLPGDPAFPPAYIVHHRRITAGSERTCPMKAQNWPCDCDKVDVDGLHACHFEYLLGTYWAPFFQPGDVQLLDLLSTHYNDEARAIFARLRVTPLYLPAGELIV
jgi:hypothetical protein